MKVIGAGFGRTGTLSLKTALEEVGLVKCYHMFEVFRRPGDSRVWNDALDGKSVDWKQLFQGFQAIVDWPGCTFYKELMDVYPDAKVVLSVRDPEKWYDSALNTIYRLTQTWEYAVVWFFLPHIRRTYAMNQKGIWQRTFGGRFEDRDAALQVFRDHIEEVKRTVPPDRLLVYDVKEGWGPLCNFLGVPIPAKPFPHANDAGSIARLLRVAAILLIALAVLVVVIAVLALQRLF
jgi:hypothetical protein